MLKKLSLLPLLLIASAATARTLAGGTLLNIYMGPISDPSQNVLLGSLSDAGLLNRIVQVKSSRSITQMTLVVRASGSGTGMETWTCSDGANSASVSVSITANVDSDISIST